MGLQILESLRQIALETRSSELHSACNHVVKCLSNDSITVQEVVKCLSRHILIFENAKLLQKHLSKIILAIISEAIPLKSVFLQQNLQEWTASEKLQHLEYCITLSILSDHPDVFQYAVKYLQINPVPPYEVFVNKAESYNVLPKKRRLLGNKQVISVHDVVTCCYTFLNKLPNKLPSIWDWSTFLTDYSVHENPKIRWMVKECITIIGNLTEAQSKCVGANLRITEKENLEYTISAIPINASLQSKSDGIDEFNTKTENVVNIDGILLPVYDQSNVHNSKLVPVKSTLNNLRSLALAVASGKALCLMGPVGSGKTSLVEHLAEITGRKGIAFKKVQLGDQTDSRMLLGTHQCTDVPGEFIWTPGVLTEAVQNGHWLLLEDIDCAAFDVASTLSSLLEKNALSVPGYRDFLPISPGFHLFVTQRTLATTYGFQKKISNSSTLLSKHLTQINVETLSRSELTEIIHELYPTLRTVSPKMIEVFMVFSVGSHDSSLQSSGDIEKDSPSVSITRNSRLISTRDLMKWCSRSVVGYDVTSPEAALKILQDALDLFTCSIPSMEDRLNLSQKIACCLGIVQTKAVFYCEQYKPNVSLHPSHLEVGRAKVKRKEKDLGSVDFDAKQVVFSFTRPSACLLEKIACCVMSNEPVLLVGETGTGKTSSIQYLAKQTGNKLVVINMNQQSDSADLLGGYKPVDLKYIVSPIVREFHALFKSSYDIEKNKKFLSHIDNCYETENWAALTALMKHSHKAAMLKLSNSNKSGDLKKMRNFEARLLKLEQQVKKVSGLTFAFIEGSLVKAMQEGHWVLLDEINLASAEVLQCLAGLLEDKSESIDLLEKGDKLPIKRHPNFTLFACMNPATDVGKKDLPVGLRNRFTEFYIDELTDKNDLIMLIGDYLYHMNLNSSILESIYRFYMNIRKDAKIVLLDGSGHAPHYSLRTLCRALTAAAKAKCGTVARSLYESLCLSFLTQLDSTSHPTVEKMIAKAVIGKKDAKLVLNQAIPEPKTPGTSHLLFEGHWIPRGKLDIFVPDDYILTLTVRKNLRDIARIISLGRLPVLLQGDTSVGKTSLITYIAKASGNKCVRINNHEHTDLQEYIGSYATDSSGKLIFKEGVLVEAMRKGYWIILDELNLAPSDVLEALNRVLDDNRELYILETQKVVKADPNFMLFATQNPPGLYGGRKMLSRAFRNRFVELHFDEIPRPELEVILHKRCHVPRKYAKNMIAVMAELQMRRRGSAAVQGKDGFITLRDLFRWGQRYKLTSQQILTAEFFYDWDQHIADEGYLILAGKVRQPDEKVIIEEVIQKHIKRKVTPENLFSLHEKTSPVTKAILEELLITELEEFSHIVWTYNMRQLAILIAKSFIFDEPVLLVGETGCGKTTVCQVLAALKKTNLHTVNCHMHTESADFLGGLRPVRQYKNDGKLFEWVDGPLIKAMEQGHMFLADEISLADDSVLERLNSLLEPERQLVLSERGAGDGNDIVVVKAKQDFHFIGTMNPGGDFGKKELSPALRNRFTEIWCESVTSRDDLLQVLEKSVNKDISLANQQDGSSGLGRNILDFTDYLKYTEVASKFPFSIRDLLSWVNFINNTVTKSILSTPDAYIHGAFMTFLDCFGTALTGHIEAKSLVTLKEKAVIFLLGQMKEFEGGNSEGLKEMLNNKQKKFSIEAKENKIGIHPFYISGGPNYNCDSKDNLSFTFSSPTTGGNTLRLLRGLQLNKAVLLEGNPGVGKTSLVTALAKISGHKVVRINLSDQTDITDLFGTDLPTEDGNFTFKEGAFLKALQIGHWILLDELNLAPQPVLEGLNACLDHRGEVYIPELGQTFKVSQQTRLFACQNPLKQGGARRGLPVSFLNRFTQVYIDQLTEEDLIFIVESQYPTISTEILRKIVKFNCRVVREITDLQYWGHRGSPWEMNLRDIQRWCDAMVSDQECGRIVKPGKYVDILYINRMRTIEDKQKMAATYEEIFCPEYPTSDSIPQFLVDDDHLMFGDVVLNRNTDKKNKSRRSFETKMVILRHQLPILRSVAQCIKMNWLSILVGPTATGKSSVVQILADLTGNELHIVPVTSALDISDLLGGFEQVDYNRNLDTLYEQIEGLSIQTVRNMWIANEVKMSETNNILRDLHKYKTIENGFSSDIDKQIENFNRKIEFLHELCLRLMFWNSHSKNEKISGEIKASINGLKKLKAKVCAAATINAGGKFEWINSLLVKSMFEGSWLLLDNVNLTSAAVLDRLNGLLEPNGVLSMSETGENYVIEPHPNFRIFFTMDPKYGEISRAMRNRGVEIFILRPDNYNLTTDERIPKFDLVALLSSCGLPYQYHFICIQAHELMASFIQGYDKPTTSHLLQAAHLTCQQIVRGIPYKLAMINSFSDVYIKPRCGGDFAYSSVNASLGEMKNAMLNELKKFINIYTIECKTENTSHTLTVAGVCRNVCYEIAQQCAYAFIQQVASGYITCGYPFLSDLFVSVQKCPQACVQMFYYIINKSLRDLQNDAVKTKAVNFNDAAYQYLTEFEHPIEMFHRFYLEAFSLNKAQISESNRKAILLYNVLLKSNVKLKLTSSHLTALDYSKAVLSGQLTDDFVEYPILKYCQKLIALIEIYTDGILKDAKTSLTDDEVCKVVELLNWRNRFIDICSKPIFVTNKRNKTPVLKEDIVNLMYLHTKWLNKYLFHGLLEMSSKSNEIIANYMELKNDAFYERNTDMVMQKIGKKLRKMYGQPKLYERHDQYVDCVQRLNLYSNCVLDLNQPIEKQKQKFILDVTQVTNASLALDIPEANVVEKFAKVTKLNEVILDNTNSNSDIKLLPVQSYVLLRIFNLVQSNLLQIIFNLKSLAHSESLEIVVNNQFKMDFANILQDLVYSAKLTRGFPPNLHNILELVSKILMSAADRKDFCERITALPSTFWIECYKYLTYSPAQYPLAFIKNSDASVGDEPVEDTPMHTKRYSINLPLLPNYVQLLMKNGNTEPGKLGYEVVALNDSLEYCMELKRLLNLIWKNIVTLDTTATIKHKSDAAFETEKYQKFIILLYSVLTSSNISELVDYSELAGETLEILQKKEICDVSFITLMKKANDFYKKIIVHIKEPTNSHKLHTKILTSKLSLLSSLLFTKLMSEISLVDEVKKHKIKVIYFKEDKKTFEALLGSYYIQGLISGTITHNNCVKKSSDVPPEYYEEGSSREHLKKVHPHCGVFLELREKTMDKIKKYISENVYRPLDVSYNLFAKDCRHFVKSLLSSESTNTIFSNMLNTIDLLEQAIVNNDHLDAIQIDKARKTSKEASTWLCSVSSFNIKVESHYSEAFPDLAKPLLSSLSQMTYSVTIFNDLLKELLMKFKEGSQLEKIVTDLVIFPNNMPYPEQREVHLNRYLSEDFMRVFDNSLSPVDDDGYHKDIEHLKILKMNLCELKTHCFAMEEVNYSSFDCVLTVLNALSSAWDKQEREIQIKKEEDEALYVTKSKCEDIDEDEQAEIEISEMFPSFSETDFDQFKPPTLDKKNIRKSSTHKKKLIMPPEDISLIYKWHSRFIKQMTNAEWLKNTEKISVRNYADSFLPKYAIFATVTQNSWEALDADMEGLLSPSLMVVLTRIKSEIDGSSVEGRQDFYHSAWVPEVKKCLLLLRKAKDITNKLLEEWPDFPSLRDVMTIVNRILNFPITSPVARFLTGLELLRDKIEEWNKNAHKGNNMIDISLEVGQQIIDWRKLELAQWKECLKNLHLKKESEAHKYWFYLYNIVVQYLETTANIHEQTETKPPTKEEIIIVLRNFVEKSNLAEYSVKLDLLYIYHCHLVHLEPSTRRDELLAIFWNTYKYYSQFLDQVSAYIKEKRAPIEKKLHAFVKICSWDRDLSYWSVKDTVEKAQKILHKHTKEFEKVLEENVAACLTIGRNKKTVSVHASGLDRPKRTATPVLSGCTTSHSTDSQFYIVQPHQLKKYLDTSESSSDLISKSSVLSKIPFYLNKAKNLCKETINNTTYSACVRSLDDLVTQVITNSERLKHLEVDRSLSKEKQISQAKNILQQKRKALADLFKYLTKMGLNYRTGLLMLSTTDRELYDFTLPPVDLDAAMAYLKPKREDKMLSIFWNGCEDYYQKNIAMHKFLTTVLLNPHKDLGMNNVERCKGFAAQLMSITVKQKKKISMYSRYLLTLRTLVSRIQESQSVKCGDPNVYALDEKLRLLSESYGYLDIVLEQFKILLKSCPEKEFVTEYGLNFDASFSDSRIVNCYRDSEEWHKLYERIASLLTSVKKQKTALQKAKKSPPIVMDNIRRQIPVCIKASVVAQEANDVLRALQSEVIIIIQDYQFKFRNLSVDGYKPQHPMLRSLLEITTYIDHMHSKINSIEQAKTKPDRQVLNDKVKIFIEHLESVVTTSLLSIENLYKNHVMTSEEEIIKAIDVCIRGDDDDQDIFKENCLKDDLQKKLTEDLMLLKFDSIITKMYDLLNQFLDILNNDTPNVQNAKDELMKTCPILGQTVLFMQYFLTQLVAAHRVSCKILSVLLSIFSDLAVEGFCNPTDLDVEVGQGEGTSSEAGGGMGLGEGEGKKDASDRIENQDQLDDARRPGEERNEEDRDCREEEKGVNMTDDFDSHLQDVEKREGENSEEDNDDDDADKQMGETDNTAEKLDMQIWGSDEDKNDEPETTDKEEKGTGESTGEKEMSAKEQEDGMDDSSKGKDKKQKKDINEMQDQEIDDDHVDRHHGKENQLPEPQDLPEDLMNMDTDDKNDQQDGETETENPFDINVIDDKVPEVEPEDNDQNGDDNKKNKDEHGMEVSSDEEGAGEECDQDKENLSDKEDKENQDEKGNQNDIDQLDQDDSDENLLDDKMKMEQTDDEDEQKDDSGELPRNPDAVDDNVDEIEQKKLDSNPMANPSNDDSSKGDKAENAEMEKGTNDNVQTNPDQEKDEDAAPFEQVQEQVGEEKRGTGRAELDRSEKGHRGEKQTAKKTRDVPNERPNTRPQNKPGRTEEERTLAEINNRKRKANRMLNTEKDENAMEEGGDEDTEDAEADAYQHVKQAKKSDQQAVDAATKEQADKQPTLKEDDEETEEMKSDDEVLMNDIDDIEMNKAENKLLPERPEEGKKKDKEKKSEVNKESGEDPTGESTVVEGELVTTDSVSRGTDTTYHTRTEALGVSVTGEELSLQQYMNIKEWLNAEVRSDAGANEAWRTLWHRTGAQARALTETLRLILEPTGRSRLTGDYRTGRRINMRRVIPYVASQFRRDRIWLRRTKPAKREYKIALAIDDSSSMNDTESMELAFESLALVTQALSLLESGDIAVLSFGTKPQILHSFSEQFSEHSGAKILNNLRFDQVKTNVAQLLDFATVMFEEQTMRSDAPNAKLLVIVGDGQGIYSEGVTAVQQAVRRARQSGIFVVYVIADNLKRKYSVMDIQTPITIFGSGASDERPMIGFTSYLDNFPIPFYLILRDLSALPTVLGDALRQWFELAANTSS